MAFSRINYCSERQVCRRMEVAPEQAPSLNTLFLRSKKRSLELFIGNRGTTSEDSKSLKLKLACKINDEYKAVKDLPPPVRPPIAPSKTVADDGIDTGTDYRSIIQSLPPSSER
jgi:hypothetical protein